MGRWRPPQQRGSPYITATGYQNLQQELNDLWLKRREVTAALSAAAAEGDRSENAEYIYRKKQQAEIDRRIRYLQKRLDELTVVNHTPEDRDRVYFGAWVTLEDAEGNETRYRIVGPDEFDIKKSFISMDSPLAQALLKKSVDDTVVVQLPSGEQEVTIVDVQYSSK